MTLPSCNLRRALRRARQTARQTAVAVNGGSPFLRNSPRIKRALFTSLIVQYPEFLRAELIEYPHTDRDPGAAPNVRRL